MCRKILFLLLFVFSFSVSYVAHSAKIAPIIYVHGVGAPYQIFTFPFSLEKYMEKKGVTLYVAKTPTTASIKNSAIVLHEEIKRLVPEGPYHLIGHSMGGLVARDAIERFNLGKRCLSLTTISTPHYGSYVADWILEQIKEKGLTTDLKKLIKKIAGGNLEVVKELSTEYAQNVFNQNTPRDYRVKYFSMGFYVPSPVYKYTQNPYILLTNHINKRYGEHESDGPVSINSSRWGVHLGDFKGDHYSNTGPIPFGGEFIFDDVFEMITLNLKMNF